MGERSYQTSYPLSQPSHIGRKAVPDQMVVRHTQNFHRRWASFLLQHYKKAPSQFYIS
jgi:hypothetical protein